MIYLLLNIKLKKKNSVIKNKSGYFGKIIYIPDKF